MLKKTFHRNISAFLAMFTKPQVFRTTAKNLCPSLQRNNSLAAISRELFKPSTASAGLLVSIKKTLLDLALGFSWGYVKKWGYFLIFDQFSWTMDANPISQ